MTASNPQLNKNGELQHLLTIDGLPREVIVAILDRAVPFAQPVKGEAKKLPLLRGKSVFNLFFENSTRTRRKGCSICTPSAITRSSFPI